MESKKRRSLRILISTNILASLISIGVGLIVGLILLLGWLIKAWA